VKRGEIWTFAGGASYLGKPRPAVVLQSDAFDGTASVTICALTSDPTEAPLVRLEIAPSETNGLHGPSRLMVDKISTVPRARAGYRLGSLDSVDMVRLERAVLVFLGMAGTVE
jgi:mRNA interferase MazF